jgi:hypothetical protein
MTMFALGLISKLLPVGLLFFASFSASPHYDLNSYSVGSGGTNSASAGGDSLQGNLGEQTNQSSTSGTYTLNGGAVKTEQLNVPLAPTLSNGSGTYYNKLLATINTGILPSDTTYALAISSNNFTTTNYIQSTGVLGATAVYQTYAAWGGASGTDIVGLAYSTSYEVKVAAKQGLFTNTEYGPYATAATVSPSITFSLSPNVEAMGSLNSGTVVTTSTPITFDLTTNASSGGNVYVAGQNNGLKSVITGHTISAMSANLATQTEGFGLQGGTATETTGGPFTIDSPYNGAVDNVGTETTTYAPVFSTTSAIGSGVATLNLLAKSASTDPSAQNYDETLTFIGSASF